MVDLFTKASKTSVKNSNITGIGRDSNSFTFYGDVKLSLGPHTSPSYSQQNSSLTTATWKQRKLGTSRVTIQSDKNVSELGYHSRSTLNKAGAVICEQELLCQHSTAFSELVPLRSASSSVELNHLSSNNTRRPTKKDYLIRCDNKSLVEEHLEGWEGDKMEMMCKWLKRLHIVGSNDNSTTTENNSTTAEEDSTAADDDSIRVVYDPDENRDGVSFDDDSFSPIDESDREIQINQCIIDSEVVGATKLQTSVPVPPPKKQCAIVRNRKPNAIWKEDLSTDSQIVIGSNSVEVLGPRRSPRLKEKKKVQEEIV
ncbi:hypothetical protein BDQ12DRAFT_749700 [Crucibulum laeve]|uniref:Uncharacterized protein n=1 Tax=Crucibulum laeve TaxID=68775 RepID=A0A5C3M0J6_9AGAR|nr:hypothetical protein BDQ12DRAFT_749700 [Crucibulum laeve]